MKKHLQELILQSVNANIEHLQEQERRMTTTVVAIVSCFTITQGPSALVFLYEILVRSPPSVLVEELTHFFFYYFIRDRRTTWCFSLKEVGVYPVRHAFQEKETNDQSVS